MAHYEEGDGCRKRWSEWSPKARHGVIAAAIVFVPVFLALTAGVTMWLWNWLMPGIFKLPAIGFWQAFGLLLLPQILFRGCRVGSARRSHWKKTTAREQIISVGPEAKAT